MAEAYITPCILNFPAICAATSASPLSFASGPIQAWGEALIASWPCPGIAGGQIDPAYIPPANGLFGTLQQMVSDTPGEPCWIIGPSLNVEDSKIEPGMGGTAIRIGPDTTQHRPAIAYGYSVAGATSAQNALIAHMMAYGSILDDHVNLMQVTLSRPEGYEAWWFRTAANHFRLLHSTVRDVTVKVTWEFSVTNLAKAREYFRRLEGLDEWLTIEGDTILAENPINESIIPQVWAIKLVSK